MAEPSVEIEIVYSAATLRGTFQLQGANDGAIFERLSQRAMAVESDYELAPNTLTVPWVTALSLIREFGPLQRKQGFIFRPVGNAKEKIDEFVRNYKAVREARGTLTEALSSDEIDSRLRTLSFTKRSLKPFQNRDRDTCCPYPMAQNSPCLGRGKQQSLSHCIS